MTCKLFNLVCLSDVCTGSLGVTLGFGRFGTMPGVWSICANEGEFFLMVSRTILLAVSASNFSSECFWCWLLPPMSWLKVMRIRSTLSVAQNDSMSGEMGSHFFSFYIVLPLATLRNHPVAWVWIDMVAFLHMIGSCRAH